MQYINKKTQKKYYILTTNAIDVSGKKFVVYSETLERYSKYFVKEYHEFINEFEICTKFVLLDVFCDSCSHFMNIKYPVKKLKAGKIGQDIIKCPNCEGAVYYQLPALENVIVG